MIPSKGPCSLTICTRWSSACWAVAASPSEEPSGLNRRIVSSGDAPMGKSRMRSSPSTPSGSLLSSIQRKNGGPPKKSSKPGGGTATCCPWMKWKVAVPSASNWFNNGASRVSAAIRSFSQTHQAELGISATASAWSPLRSEHSSRTSVLPKAPARQRNFIPDIFGGVVALWRFLRLVCVEGQALFSAV